MTATRLAACAAVLLCSRADAFAHGGCTPGWTPDTGITAPIITNPTAGNNGRGINAEVLFTCSTCTDQDRYQYANCSYGPPVQDGLTYTWTKTGGSWKNGVSTGQSVTWIAPNSPEEYTIAVTVDDDGSPPGTGDPPRSAYRDMEVMKLDTVRLYMHHYGTAYPYVDTVGYPDDVFKTRAVVWATCETQGAYCDILFDETLAWWFFPGSEGPLDSPDDQEPPDTPFFSGTVDDWPNNWPSLTILWTAITHVASDRQGLNWVYSYPEGQPWQWTYLANSWGEDDRHYNTVGLHRIRATATMHPGTLWSQPVTSLDEEFAFDIRPRYHISRAGTAQRNRHVERISGSMQEPYEYGGEYFGGYDSGGNRTGSDPGYEGYGVDCSGLVSIGAWRTDYNWPTNWRQNTEGIASSTYSTELSEADFDEGDVLVKAGSHVLSCKDRNDVDPNVITIIHASAGASKVTVESSTLSEWMDDNYDPRRLRPYQ